MGDYDDLAKDLILQAATVYRCLLTTEDAFPDLAAEAKMVKTAWGNVNGETGLTPLRLTPDIAKMVSVSLLYGAILIWIQIKARGSQARGEIKEKTKPLVEGLFGFDSSHGRKAIIANRKWAEELKCERGFIYISFIIMFYFIVTLFRRFTVAHKTVPMFCCNGQKDLVWNDHTIHGSETYVQQTTPSWLCRTI